MKSLDFWISPKHLNILYVFCGCPMRVLADLRIPLRLPRTVNIQAVLTYFLFLQNLLTLYPWPRFRFLLHREVFRLWPDDRALAPGGRFIPACSRLPVEELPTHSWNSGHARSSAAHHASNKIAYPEGCNLPSSGERMKGRSGNVKPSTNAKIFLHRFTPTKTTSWRA